MTTRTFTSIRALLLLVITMMALPMRGEDPQLAFLRQQLKGQTLFIRYHSAEFSIHYKLQGAQLVMTAPRYRTIGKLKIDSVKMKKDVVEITGRRTTLQWDGKKESDSDESLPVTIQVDISGGTADTIFPQLRKLLFYADEAEALQAAPSFLQHSPKSNAAAHVPCDCASLNTEGCHLPEPEYGMTGVSEPRILKQVQPDFSEAARNARTGGHSTIMLQIDPAGNARDFWVAKSAGLGLDEQAVWAVSQYKFAPVMCHDTPVAIHIFVDINFDLH